MLRHAQAEVDGGSEDAGAPGAGMELGAPGGLNGVAGRLREGGRASVARPCQYQPDTKPAEAFRAKTPRFFAKWAAMQGSSERPGFSGRKRTA